MSEQILFITPTHLKPLIGPEGTNDVAILFAPDQQAIGLPPGMELGMRFSASEAYRFAELLIQMAREAEGGSGRPPS